MFLLEPIELRGEPGIPRPASQNVKCPCGERSVFPVKLSASLPPPSTIVIFPEGLKGLTCHPASLNFMHSTSCEMLGWMKPKLESRLLGEISITSDMQMTAPLWQKAKQTQRAS